MHFPAQFILILVLSLSFPPFCQADILPFDLNIDKPSSHSSAAGSNYNNNLNVPNEIVVFHRWVRATPPHNDFRVIQEFRRDEHFVINETFNSSNEAIELQCKANLHPYFTFDNETITLPVSWVTDDGEVLSNTSLLQLRKPNQALKIRCRADLRDLEGIINGLVLSRSIHFSHKAYTGVQLLPKKVHALPNSPIRLVCYWEPPAASAATWKHDNKILYPSKDLRIDSISGKSVLHILSASSKDAGDYQCLPANASYSGSETTSVIVDEQGTLAQNTELPPTLTAAFDGEAMMECLFPGTKGVRWLLDKRPNRRKNETLPRTDSKFLGNSTILTLKNISKNWDGNIKCIVEVSNDSLITKETEFKLLDPSYFNYAPSAFSEVLRKQGTPLTFRCETYELLGETPEMAQWYLNGKRIQRTPNIKISRGTDHGVGYADLVVAITEAENEGLYTCIIASEEQERIRQLIFQVDVTTNETITELSVTTDHLKSCVKLQFKIPESTDLEWAHFTPFFVVIHETNSTASLNSLPLMAKCNKRKVCKLDICQDTGSLQDATEYVFRMSMVQSGSGTVITPQSQPVTATTWDAVAKRSVPLKFAYNATEKVIDIQWDIPSDVKGKVTSFAVQIINFSNHTSNLLAPIDREYYERPLNQRSFRITNVTDPFAYKVRVTPFTRKGKLPVVSMPRLEFFPFIIVSSDGISRKFDQRLPIPRLALSQVDRQPLINASWNVPDDTYGIYKVLLQYQHVANRQSRYISTEQLVNTTSTLLKDGIEEGLVYQVCAAFVRESDDAQSPWKCDIVPVKNAANALTVAVYKDALKPPPITCENNSCRCAPSNVTEGGIRVDWVNPAGDDVDADDPELLFKVYYTLNETDANANEYEFAESGSQSFVELPPLLPNTTYQIMIETLNKHNHAVPGAYFSCHTPPSMPLPPPKNFQFGLLNATHVKFRWTPFENEGSQVWGYTIYWQVENRQPVPLFIPGAESSSYVVGGLRPEPLYQAYIVSRSPAFENSPAKSPKLSFRLPPAMAASFEEVPDASTQKPSFYRDPSLTTVLIVVATIGSSLLVIVLFAAGIYFCCLVPLWKRQKQHRREVRERARSNASSALSLDSGSGGEEVEAIAMEPFVTPLLQLPPDPPGSFDLPKDPAGPPGGPRPLGQKRYRQMIQDDQFRERISELNSDPTGLGLPAGTRDACYLTLQNEDDRRFQAIVAREKREIEKRRTGRKKRKTSKFSNIAETSFGEGSSLTPNPSILDDTVSHASEDGSSRKCPASFSMTELNKPSQGLSPRSHSIAIYRRFFPRKRPQVLPDATVEALTNPPLKQEVHAPASSLPNLADSGIVFDHHSSSSAMTNGYGNPFRLPTIRQASRSGSTTLVDEVESNGLLPSFHHPHHRRPPEIQDCRQLNNSTVLGTAKSPVTLVP